MIALFTDFGTHNPYVGQLHAKIAELNPNIPVIDLLHYAPRYDVKRSAYLLKALCAGLPAGTIVIGIVDPGVGTKRDAIGILSNDIWYIGPDNGLFSLLIDSEDESSIYEISYQPDQPSNTFHGRDIFAPVAAEIAKGQLDTVLSTQQNTHSLTRDFALLWPKSLAEVIFIDDYGNATTGLRLDKLKRDQVLTINFSILPYRRTFARARVGEPFWTINSMGLVEIAANQANAAALLSLKVGDSVELK